MWPKGRDNPAIFLSIVLQSEYGGIIAVGKIALSASFIWAAALPTDEGFGKVLERFFSVHEVGDAAALIPIDEGDGSKVASGEGIVDIGLFLEALFEGGLAFPDFGRLDLHGVGVLAFGGGLLGAAAFGAGAIGIEPLAAIGALFGAVGDGGGVAQARRHRTGGLGRGWLGGEGVAEGFGEFLFEDGGHFGVLGEELGEAGDEGLGGLWGGVFEEGLQGVRGGGEVGLQGLGKALQGGGGLGSQASRNRTGGREQGGAMPLIHGEAHSLGWSVPRSRGVEGARSPLARGLQPIPRPLLQLLFRHTIAGGDGFGGEVEDFGGGWGGVGLEVEGGEVGAAGEGAVEEGVGDGAVEGGGNEGGVAADDGAPGFLVGAGGALADAGGAGEGGEHAAGGHEDDELLLVLEELLEGVDAAGLLGVGDGGAGGEGAGGAVVEVHGARAEGVDLGGVDGVGHGDDDGGDAVALEEAAPFAFAEAVAEVDGHGGVVDVAGADEGDEFAGGNGLEGGEVEGFGGGGVPVPAVGEEVAAEVPGVEGLEAAEGEAVGRPEGAGMGVAAEEGFGEVFDGGEEVVFLGVAIGVLEEGGLLGGEGLVEAAGAAGGLGAHRPVEVDEGGGAAFGADHQRGVGLLDVFVDPLEADVVAAAGGVEDHLGAAEGEAAEGVVALEPGVGGAVGTAADEGGQDDGPGGCGLFSRHRRTSWGGRRGGGGRRRRGRRRRGGGGRGRRRGRSGRLRNGGRNR